MLEVHLVVESPEDVIIPPLQELTFICKDMMTETKCQGPSIFRDPDVISAMPSDIISSMSINSLIKYKSRGRKLERWEDYINKYKINISGEEFSIILKLDPILTLYVDGYDFEGVSGDAVIKEFRLAKTSVNDELIIELSKIKPNLIVIRNKLNYWNLISAYKVEYIDKNLIKAFSKLIGIKRIECNSIKNINLTKVCTIES
jgi:hypothetical protein